MLKKCLVIALTYLGKLSPQVRKRINHMMENKSPYCNLCFAFQTKCKINDIFYL